MYTCRCTYNIYIWTHSTYVYVHLHACIHTSRHACTFIHTYTDQIYVCIRLFLWLLCESSKLVSVSLAGRRAWKHWRPPRRPLHCGSSCRARSGLRCWRDPSEEAPRATISNGAQVSNSSHVFHDVNSWQSSFFWKKPDYKLPIWHCPTWCAVRPWLSFLMTKLTKIRIRLSKKDSTGYFGPTRANRALRRHPMGFRSAGGPYYPTLSLKPWEH